MFRDERNQTREYQVDQPSIRPCPPTYLRMARVGSLAAKAVFQRAVTRILIEMHLDRSFHIRGEPAARPPPPFESVVTSWGYSFSGRPGCPILDSDQRNRLAYPAGRAAGAPLRLFHPRRPQSYSALRIGLAKTCSLRSQTGNMPLRAWVMGLHSAAGASRSAATPLFNSSSTFFSGPVSLVLRGKL